MQLPPTDSEHVSLQHPQQHKQHVSSPFFKTKERRWGIGLLALLGVAALCVPFVEFEYAYMPPLTAVLNATRGNQSQAYDLWGRAVSQADATRMLRTSEGRAQLSAHNGAVRIDERVLTLGRTAFYRETFGNEVFLSDIMGILTGPLTPWRMTKALWRLGGKGTTNLQIPLEEEVKIGGITFPKGTVLNTGLDVVPGTYLPLGLKVKVTQGRLVAGITCALCHATVNPQTMRVIEGAMNTDFNGGLVLALASNSAAYLGHAGVTSLTPFATDPTRRITTTTGTTALLPNP